MGRFAVDGKGTIEEVTKNNCFVLCPAEWCHCVAVSHSQILNCQSVLGLIEEAVSESN
jgi:hypothetical protein